MKWNRLSATLVLMIALAACRGQKPVSAILDAQYGKIKIETIPPGAKVILDGMGKGVTPMTIPGVNPGNHELIITKSTYFPTQMTLPVVAGKVASENIVLTRHKKVEERQVPKVPGATIMWIASGRFVMGSPDYKKCIGKLETMQCKMFRPGPLSRVTLNRGFWMWRTEVTQKQFREMVNYNPSKFKDCDDCPVENVSWHEAAAFCNVLSKKTGLPECYDCSKIGPAAMCLLKNKYRSKKGRSYYRCPGWRLPTEAEWEYAARANRDRIKYDNIKEVAWFWKNADRKTHPVGKKKPNPFGLHDMLGNVLEWCWAEDLAKYPEGWATDPAGPARRPDGVARGGGWGSSENDLRVEIRNWILPPYRHNYLGFRVVTNGLLNKDLKSP